MVWKPSWRGVLGITAVAVLVAALLAGYMLWRTPTEPPAEQLPPAQRQRVQLYFGDSQARYLIAEQRLLPACEDTRACMRQVLAALIAGPAQQGLPVVPKQTQLLRLQLQQPVVILDFNKALRRQHPGGSASELLTVYALANTIAANFPDYNQVRIWIEGQAQETLKGHLDLTRPIAADFGYCRGLDAPTTPATTSPVD